MAQAAVCSKAVVQLLLIVNSHCGILLVFYVLLCVFQVHSSLAIIERDSWLLWLVRFPGVS